MSTLTKEQDGIAVTSIAAPFTFLPPGNINDFPENSGLHKELLDLWNQNLTGFTNQAIIGNTWNSINTPPTPNYYNPATTTPIGTVSGAGVPWIPFPGRFTTYYGPNSTTPLGDEQMWELADTGYYTDDSGNKVTFPQITSVPCTAFQPQAFPSNGPCGCSGDATDMIPYGPYGPRGWQDEYCEWSVTRNDKNEITRIDFTCENPEYWNTLWLVDPTKVRDIYRTTLGNPNIQTEDLQLYSGGKVVTDPGTKRPAYNPLNKWNTGPVTSPTGGGAMHLTSTPNSLQTEIGLGAAATVLRTPVSGPNNIQTLLCSAQYGQYGRQSDPHIGAGINGFAANGNAVTLFNPPGLYMQLPANLDAEFTIDGVSEIAPYFQVTRGGEPVTVTDDKGNSVTYYLNLHLTVEAPAGMPALSNMMISNVGPLRWASQIAQKMTMAILASYYPTSKQTPLACSAPATTNLHAQPLQLFHQNIFDAMNGTPIPNPVNFPMTLLSNSTFVPPMVSRTPTHGPIAGAYMTLTYLPISFDDVQPGHPETYPTVTFDDPNVTGTVNGVEGPITYAVPGNSYPGQVLALNILVKIAPGTNTGLKGIRVKDAKETGVGPFMPALLNITA
jgi:hypothetical protein